MPSCLPSTLAPIFPPLSPHGAQPRPLPYIPSPCLAAVVRSGCHTTRRLAFRRSSGTHAAFRAAFCKIFFRAREAFRLFRAVLPSSFVPALWLTRRRVCTPLHAKETGLFAKLRAVSILLRINILYTQKKFRFLQKKTCKKLAYIKNTYYLCKRKITTTLLTRSLNLLYIYIGKIKSPQLAATGFGRREGKTLHCLL